MTARRGQGQTTVDPLVFSTFISFLLLLMPFTSASIETRGILLAFPVPTMSVWKT